MILLVAAGDAAQADASAIDGDLRVRESPSAARELLAGADFEVVVLDATSVSTADALLRDLRAGEVGSPATPVVLLVEGERPADLPLEPFDEVLSRPFRTAALTEAVDRASRVSEYREAVERLYRRCRSRADEGTVDPLTEDAELVDARSEADELLSDLLDRPEVLSSLLWSDERGEF